MKNRFASGKCKSLLIYLSVLCCLMISSEAAFAQICTATGQLQYQRYDDLMPFDSQSIADLRAAAKFPDAPDSELVLSSLFEAPTDVAEDYGVRITGVLCVPQTGNYTFWIAGDDNVELNLSTSADASGLQRIAYHNSWTSPRDWSIFPEQRSTEIFLQQGQSYFIEALMKEGFGGDNLAVGWQLPNGVLQRPIPAAVFSLPGAIEPGPVSIITNSLSGGTENQAYSATLAASGGSGTYTWSINSGGLPVGLNLDASGLLNGTPSVSGVFNFAVYAEDNADANNSDTQALSLTIYVEGTEPLCNASGQLRYQRYDDTTQSGGVSISALRADANFPNTPSSELVLTDLFEAPTDVAEDYGVRISGILCAPQTGNYTFWVAGDDNVELSLSDSADANGLQRIAYHNEWTSSRDWEMFPEQRSTEIFLQQGQSYYIEALMKEGYGGDNLAVGWQLPDGVLQRPISAAVFSLANADEPVPVNITTSSLSSGTENQSYSETLTATGGGGSYTWSVSAGNLPTGITLSSAGILSGTPTQSDIFNFTAAAIDSADASNSDTQALSLSIAAATVPVNISTNSLNAGTENQTYSATLTATGGSGVYLWSLASGSLPSGMNLSSAGLLNGTPTVSGDFNFTVRAVDSADANNSDTQALSLSIAAGAGSCAPSGQLLYQRYDNVLPLDSRTIVALRAAEKFPDAADSELILSSLFEAPTGVGEEYGARISGVLCAPQTGNYTFWIAGDDNVELNLSTSADASGLQRIAYHYDWTPSREWSNFPEQRSALIYLEQGQSYFIEALMKEAYGGDNLAVGWQLPNGVLQRPIPATVFSLADGSAPGAVTITSTSLVAGTTGIPYAVNLLASGGSGSYGWSIAAGNLPMGYYLKQCRFIKRYAE